MLWFRKHCVITQDDCKDAEQLLWLLSAWFWPNLFSWHTNPEVLSIQNSPRIPSCSEQTTLPSLCMATPWQWFLLGWRSGRLLHFSPPKITGFVWITEVFSRLNQSRIAKGQKRAKSELWARGASAGLPWGLQGTILSPLFGKGQGAYTEAVPQIHNPTVQCIYNHT